MDSVIAFALGVLIVALGLAISIALHEIGHLVPAKLFGVKVTQYMIGFGPTLFSRRRGETEYGVKALPLGGYISMIGMFPPEKNHPAEAGATEFGSLEVAEIGEKTAAPVAARAGSTGFFQNLATDAREVSAESITPGDESRAFYLLPVWKRIIVMFGGPFMNLLIGVVLFAVLLMGFGTAQSSTTIASVSECVLPATSERQTCEPGDTAAPGAAAGLEPGDRIVSISGTPIETWEQSTAIIRESAGTPLPVVVERDGEMLDLTVTPLLSERFAVDDEGKVVTDDAGEPVTTDYGFVGIGPSTVLVPQPATSVLPAVGDNIVAVANVILNLPQRLIDTAQAAFGPEERDPNGPMSVVGVGRVAGEIAAFEGVPIESKAASLIGIVASLNVMLFVFNLIPLLPLDGGHIAGALWEGIRRFFAKLFRRPDPGPVDIARLMPITFAVVIVIGAMSALLIYADIVKPISFF
ncbi:site-2 protease family protein [Agromyces atrinae]|uniref:Membrane-associated protease RseP (Regulator of RpoE activity) n=1 Tax=Agromyces atrinae TaxID=592376 RepID=A0A4Q2M1G0_9MICO|nr:site-2 protease family protein [Agromyces atrinae]MCI2959006.1 site-2 protease family protein [Agromyces atrinae]NYD65768.1 membrane-associated protease RseP (regulator of RpoE activity) [Agromyces atrinae]RXZ85558.1 RIP metalloprotease [Agromyces atrinae]